MNEGLTSHISQTSAIDFTGINNKETKLGKHNRAAKPSQFCI